MRSRNEAHKKAQMEFSKVILLVSWISGAIVILYAMALTLLMVVKGYTGDISLISIILTGGFAEISAGTAFYFWKAKNENMQKIGNNIGGYEDEEH